MVDTWVLLLFAFIAGGLFGSLAICVLVASRGYDDDATASFFRGYETGQSEMLQRWTEKGMLRSEFSTEELADVRLFDDEAQ
jgi:hypothetical protein